MKNSAINRVLLVQPPFIQLNGPYPAPYYLRSFLETHGCRVLVRDHSIGLFERIFCSRGLGQIFGDARNLLPALEKSPAKDKNTVRMVERFLSEEELWLASIDRLIAFLRGGDREFGYLLSLANGILPGGPRTDAFIAEYSGEIPLDASRLLASGMLADLADFISAVLDNNFSLIQYKPFAGGSFRDFKKLENDLHGYIMDVFYRPYLEDEWNNPAVAGESPELLGLTIPFPGCLVSSLVCAESARKHFGKELCIAAGGGFVNTELKFSKSTELSNYFDHLSFDRPYAFLLSLLEGSDNSINSKMINDDGAAAVFPNYSGLDFSRYLYPADNANPMHRLWSDGHWLKAYLSHGCYWHSCSFCDVTLDYIREYIPVNVPSLFAHLQEQVKISGCRGVHLVDEAAPAASLLELSLLNRRAGLPFIFWGNIRLEKAFSSDTAAILAGGGLVGVSAGLEAATEEGLRRMGKGLGLKDMVRACASLKEAGILVHGYLIFGYWDEDEQDIINSAEIVRQFFCQGLLDSAFWHKFTLTRHSRLYAEKMRGLHPELKILDDDEDSFCLNDLSFEGEERFSKYAEPLDRLLSAWMEGQDPDAFESVEWAFPFRVKAPSVSPDTIRLILDEYARDRDRQQKQIPHDNKVPETRLIFLGSGPIANRGSLWWRWRLEDRLLKTGESAADKIRLLLNKAAETMETGKFYSALETILGKDEAARAWKVLRKSGLALFQENR